ncbi:MAG: hypothetical protein ACPIE8_00440 [Henriciella sp.]
MNQLVTQPHPFKEERAYSVAPQGATVQDIVEQEILDPVLRAHTHVSIEDVYIPRDNWAAVRPNPGCTVYLKVYPHGGGGGGRGRGAARRGRRRRGRDDALKLMAFHRHSTK